MSLNAAFTAAQRPQTMQDYIGALLTNAMPAIEAMEGIWRTSKDAPYAQRLETTHRLSQHLIPAAIAEGRITPAQGIHALDMTAYMLEKDIQRPNFNTSPRQRYAVGAAKTMLNIHEMYNDRKEGKPDAYYVANAMRALGNKLSVAERPDFQREVTLPVIAERLTYKPSEKHIMGYITDLTRRDAEKPDIHVLTPHGF